MEEKNTYEQQGQQAPVESNPTQNADSQTNENPAADAASQSSVDTTASAVTTSPNKTPWTFIAAVIVVIALLSGGVWWLSQSSDDTQLGTPTDGTAGTAAPSFSAADYPEVIAVVNGVEIGTESFIQGLEQAAQQVAQQGADPNDEATRAQMESQTTTALVNTELLTQAAREAGVTADPAAVDAEIDSIIAQFENEERFQEQLALADITVEELRADLAEQLTIDAFIRQTPEWEASGSIEEGEAQAFYDDISSQNPDQELPPFAEVEAAIEEQLLGTKQQEITQSIIERLRADADIEVMIE